MRPSPSLSSLLRLVKAYESGSARIARGRLIKPLALLLLFALLLPLLSIPLPFAVDWTQVYRPASLAMLRGGNPYETPGFYNPPWTLLPLIPFAVLPDRIGRVGLFFVSLLAFSIVPYKLRAKPFPALLFMTSAPVLGCLHDGNIDFLPLLALFLPAPFALLLAPIKPQVGGGLLLYYLGKEGRRGFESVFAVFLPLGLLALSSFNMYGLPVAKIEHLRGVYWNLSLFPYTVPVGLFLLWQGWKREEPLLALASSPFFSPYFTGFSLVGILAYFMERPRLMVIVWVLLWAPIVAEAYLL